MNKNAEVNFSRKTPGSSGSLTTNQPTNFFSCSGYRTEPHGPSAFPILPSFCLFLSRYRPGEHHLAVALGLFVPRAALIR
jgi:hypothetical protein